MAGKISERRIDELQEDRLQNVWKGLTDRERKLMYLLCLHEQAYDERKDLWLDMQEMGMLEVKAVFPKPPHQETEQDLMNLLLDMWYGYGSRLGHADSFDRAKCKEALAMARPYKGIVF